MKKQYLLYFILSIFTMIVSCDLTEDPVVGGTNTQEMAGEWYLQLLNPVDSSILVDYSLATTSNTSANVASSMWITDAAHFWDFQCKMNTNQQNLSFNADKVDNLLYDPSHKAPAANVKPAPPIGEIKTVLSTTPRLMSITNGKISQDSYTPPSKTKTDYLSCLMSGWYRGFNYVVDSYVVTGVDTSVVWKLKDESDVEDGPYLITGYKRTGFLEDEH